MVDVDALLVPVAQYYREAVKFQHEFDGLKLYDYMTQHAEIPVFCVTLYLGMVFYGPLFMKDRPAMKFHHLFTLWNLLLATFSICGSYVVVPVLIDKLQNEGWWSSICANPHNWFDKGMTSFWAVAFILSKIPELLDTFFLIAQKKGVIFLHWYHHTTVMLYCWHAYITTNSSGMWFSAMNYVVHSIMYSYYFFMNVSPLTRKLVKPTAKLITTLQLVQMVQGLIVSISSFYYLYSPRGCHVDPANTKMGLFMYFTYFVLFAYFFQQSYGKNGRKTRQPRENDDNVCTATVDEVHRGVPRQENGVAKKKQ